MVCEPCFPAWLHGPAGSGKARIGLGLSRDPAQSPHWGFWELWSGQSLARKADETGQQRSVAGQPGAPCRHCPLAFMTPQEGAPPEAGGPGAPVVACGCPSSDVLWGWPPLWVQVWHLRPVLALGHGGFCTPRSCWAHASQALERRRPVRRGAGLGAGLLGLQASGLGFQAFRLGVSVG